MNAHSQECRFLKSGYPLQTLSILQNGTGHVPRTMLKPFIGADNIDTKNRLNNICRSIKHIK